MGRVEKANGKKLDTIHRRQRAVKMPPAEIQTVHRKERAFQGGGHPSLLETKPEIKPIILDAIKDGNYITTAFAAAGIDHKTKDAWDIHAGNGIEPFYSFMVEVAKAFSQAELDMMKKLRMAGDDPKHWPAIAWIFERTRSGRFSLNKQQPPPAKIEINFATVTQVINKDGETKLIQQGEVKRITIDAA